MSANPRKRRMIIGSAVTLVLGIIAAFAIPNMLESRMSGNESNAAAALKIYEGAQTNYKKNNYGGVPANGLTPWQFAPSFKFLGGKNAHKSGKGTPLTLIPDVFANSTKETGYMGYYFIDGKVENLLHEYSLFAVPNKYVQSGTNCYWINQEGIVRMKNMSGKIPTPDLIIDDAWVVP